MENIIRTPPPSLKFIFMLSFKLFQYGDKFLSENRLAHSSKQENFSGIRVKYYVMVVILQKGIILNCVYFSYMDIVHIIIITIAKVPISKLI